MSSSAADTVRKVEVIEDFQSKPHKAGRKITCFRRVKRYITNLDVPKKFARCWWSRSCQKESTKQFCKEDTLRLER